MKSPGLVAGGIVMTVLSVGMVAGALSMIAVWGSDNLSSYSDEDTKTGFYEGAGTMIAFGVVGTIAGVILISQGARHVVVRPGLGSVSLSGTF